VEGQNRVETVRVLLAGVVDPGMEERRGPDGATLYLARDAERGNKGPFRVVYADPAAEVRWGYYCTHCSSFDNAVDSMGRIKCNACANFHTAEEWDAAHE
jgi:hypothetical protein